MNVLRYVDAKRNGEKIYYSGKPCHVGHICGRYTANRHCVDCTNSQALSWAKRNPDKSKSADRRFKDNNPHACTLRLMSDEQQALALSTPKPDQCPVCFRSEVRVVLDHCHDTGRFRGWICDRCNMAIGLLGESRVNVSNLLRYLNG